MLKKSLMIYFVIVITTPAFAGQLTKIHNWEINWKKELLAEIDVIACVGHYFFLDNEEDIEVSQDQGKNAFSGCSDPRTIITNFQANIYATITGSIYGSFKVGFGAIGGPAELTIPAGETDIILCVSATNVNILNLTAGECHKIATITLEIVPAASPVHCGCVCP